jgi:hypothetical protein
MRKFITGASIFLIFLSVYGLLKAVFDPHPLKLRSAIASTPTPNPNIQLAASTSLPAPIPQSTHEPIPLAKSTLEPLKRRVVSHQPDQFRKGAVDKDELLAIKKAIKSIPWSLNANPEAAANEDYAAIVKECEKSGERDLMADLVAEAAANDYQPKNEAANAAYSTELNSDFENGHQSDSLNGKSTGEMTAGQEPSIDRALTPAVNQPGPPPVAPSSSPAQRPTPAEITRAKTVHVRHRATVRRRIVDAKTRLLELWHQSLAQTEKASKLTLLSDPQDKK